MVKKIVDFQAYLPMDQMKMEEWNTIYSITTPTCKYSTV